MSNHPIWDNGMFRVTSIWPYKDIDPPYGTEFIEWKEEGRIAAILRLDTLSDGIEDITYE